jgi:hypothetical protein
VRHAGKAPLRQHHEQNSEATDSGQKREPDYESHGYSPYT